MRRFGGPPVGRSCRHRQGAYQPSRLWHRRGLVAGVLPAALILIAAPIRASAATDPLLAQQWHLARIGASAAWQVTRGQGVTIAVVDSGVDAAHEDLRGHLVGQTACLGTLGDKTKCSGDAGDDQGHGTHVAGIALATLGDGVGGAGVAPDARLLAVKTLAQLCQANPSTGQETCIAQGTSDDTAAGIRWAVDHGAKVVNLSLGEPVAVRAVQGTQLADDVEYAWDHGAVVVIAAGNDNDALMGSRYPDLPMIVVTATGPDDKKPAYANSTGGPPVRWGLAAPGGAAAGDCPRTEILSTTFSVTGSHNTYGCMAGTSMATPVVSGAVALMLSAGLSPQEAVNRLISTADDLGAPGKDAVFGYGLVDLRRAVQPFLASRGGSGSPSGSGTSSGRRSASAAPAPGGATSSGRPAAAPQVRGRVEQRSPAQAAPSEAPADAGAAGPTANGSGSGGTSSPAGVLLAGHGSGSTGILALVAAVLVTADLGLLRTRQLRRRRLRPRP